MRRLKCVLACGVALLLACAGGTEAVREGSTGAVAPVEGCLFVEGATEGGEGSLPGAFLPGDWEH